MEVYCIGRITDLAGYCISHSKAFIKLQCLAPFIKLQCLAPFIKLQCLALSSGQFNHAADLRFNIFFVIIMFMEG